MRLERHLINEIRSEEELADVIGKTFTVSKKFNLKHQTERGTYTSTISKGQTIKVLEYRNQQYTIENGGRHYVRAKWLYDAIQKGFLKRGK